MTSIESILCVTKRTRWEILKAREAEWQKLDETRRREEEEVHLRQKEYERDVVRILRESGFQAHTKKQKKAYDLIITLGGDGLVLKTGLLFPYTPILPINSNPSSGARNGSIGALTTVKKEDTEKAIADLRIGAYKIIERERLRVTHNEETFRIYPTNELFVGATDPTTTSRISLQYENETEHYYCSGVIVCTPTGSTAWYRNAGGKSFKEQRGYYGFIVREPVRERWYRRSMGQLAANEVLEVKVEGFGQQVYFDGNRYSRKVSIGDTISVTLEGEPMKVLLFDEKGEK